MKSAKDILSDLVKIPSVSSMDNSPVIDLIGAWFSDYEKTIQEWKRDDGVPGKSLIVKIPGTDHSSSLVFICHMDTVPESKEWKTSPFELIEQDGKLYGLGSCDTKGGTASLIQAVLTLEKKPKVDTYIVFSGDEEVSSAGLRMLKDNMPFQNPKFIFIEPTDNNVLISQRSIFQLTVTTHGVAQHGSYATPDENVKNNAIFKMSTALQTLILDAEEIAEEKDSLLGSNTQNFGVITGGTARNVMADTCILKLDRRLLPTRDLHAEFNRVEPLLKEKDSSIEVELGPEYPSFSTQVDSKLVQDTLSVCKKHQVESMPAGFQAWSEAGLFKEYPEVIILGPGSISQAHRANEYIEGKDLETYVGIFRDLIIGL